MNLYVSYEIAVLLKEKGFDLPTIACYYKEYKVLGFCLVPTDSNNSDYTNVVSAPTHQEVVDWFLNKYKIFIEIRLLRNKNKFYYTLYYLEKGDGLTLLGTDSYETPFDAMEAAIKYKLSS